MDDITIIKNDTNTLRFTFSDSDGNIINLTNGKVYLTVKRNIDDSDDDAVLKKDITAFSDPTNGITTMELSTSESAIPPGAYYYDVQFKDSSDRVRSDGIGRFIVNQDITTRIS